MGTLGGSKSVLRHLYDVLRFEEGYLLRTRRGSEGRSKVPCEWAKRGCLIHSRPMLRSSLLSPGAEPPLVLAAYWALGYTRARWAGARGLSKSLCRWQGIAPRCSLSLQWKKPVRSHHVCIGTRHAALFEWEGTPLLAASAEALTEWLVDTSGGQVGSCTATPRNVGTLGYMPVDAHGQWPVLSKKAQTQPSVSVTLQVKIWPTRGLAVTATRPSGRGKTPQFVSISSSPAVDEKSGRSRSLLQVVRWKRDIFIISSPAAPSSLTPYSITAIIPPC